MKRVLAMSLAALPLLSLAGSNDLSDEGVTGNHPIALLPLAIIESSSWVRGAAAKMALLTGA